MLFSDAELCNGSTADSDSVCLGSNPSSAANKISSDKTCRSLFFKCYIARDVAQFGSALRSGRRGRRFKSCHPDHKDRLFSGLFPFVLHFVLHKSLEVLKYDLICFLGFIA